MSDFVVTVDQIAEIRRIISKRHGIPLSKWSELVPDLVSTADDRNTMCKWIRDDKVSQALGYSLEIWSQTEGRNATFNALLFLFRKHDFNGLADELEQWAWWDSINTGSSNHGIPNFPVQSRGSLRRSRSTAAVPYSSTLPWSHLDARRAGPYTPLQRSASDRSPSSQRFAWDREYGALRRSDSQSAPAYVPIQPATIQNRKYFGANDERHVRERHAPLQRRESDQKSIAVKFASWLQEYGASQSTNQYERKGVSMSIRSPSTPSSAWTSTASLNQFSRSSPARRGWFGGSTSSFSEAETKPLAATDYSCPVGPSPSSYGTASKQRTATKSHRKSNRQQIQGAVGRCIFPGKLDHIHKSNILDAIERSTAENFLVHFRDFRLQFRGIYTVQEIRGREVIVRLCGTGPRQITEDMLDVLYKYDCVSKCFISCHHMVDGFTIHNKCWAKKGNIAKP